MIERDVRQPVATNGGDWVQKYGSVWNTQVALLQEAFQSAIEEVRLPTDSTTDVPIIYVKIEKLIECLKFLKEHPQCQYSFLADFTATDEEGEVRFELVYQLLSHQNMARIRVKTRIKEGQEVPTAIPLWEGANWAEREIWDMFGIRFSGHPDLRRILMDHRWEGHPLRKDYPLRGYQVFPTPEAIDPKLLQE